MKKLLLSSSFITIAVMGLNFIFKIYLSYKISKEDIGLFWTFLDMVSIGIIFFSGFKDSLILSHDRDNFNQTLYWYIRSFWLLFAVVLVGEIVYFNILDFKYPLYFLILILSANALMIFFSYLNASYKVYKVMLFENLTMTIGLIGSFFTLSHFIDSIDALLFAFLISFGFRIFYIIYFSKIEWSVKKCSVRNVKAFFRNSIYSGGVYFFSGFFISMSGIMLLKLFEDTAILAEYQVVVRSIFFSLVAVFVFPLNTFTFPQISKFISENRIGEIVRVEKILLKYLFIFFILLILGTFLTKSVIGFIFPIEYRESYKMLNILLPLLPFIAYTTFAINIIKGFDRFDLALYIRVLGTVLFFVSIYIFYILNMDATSIVYSLDMSFLGMFILSYYYKQRLLK